MSKLEFLKGLPQENVLQAARAHGNGMYTRFIDILRELHLQHPEEQKHDIELLTEMKAQAQELIELGVFDKRQLSYANIERMASLDIERLLVMNKRAFTEHNRVMAHNKPPKR